MNTQIATKKGRGRPKKEVQNPIDMKKVVEALEEDLLLTENALELERNKHRQTQDYMDRLEEELRNQEAIVKSMVFILFLMNGGK